MDSSRTVLTQKLSKDKGPKTGLSITFDTTPKRGGDYNDTTTHTWNLENQLDIHEYLGVCKFPFEEAGWVESAPAKTCGYNICVNQSFKGVTHLLYLVVIGNKILKGGKSKQTLPKRTYGAGTEKNWTEKGSPSETNYIYSQIFRSCLEKKIDVKFWCYKCPLHKVPYPTPSGETKFIEISPYEEMEKALNKHLIEINGGKPIGEGKLFEINKF